eukprot:1149431-Prorocentrum_minimum.AAC.2
MAPTACWTAIRVSPSCQMARRIFRGSMTRSTPAVKVAPRPRLARVGGRRPARTLARGEVLTSSVMCRP